MTAIVHDGIYETLSDVDYHRHRSLSSSGARALLACPARFAFERDHPREDNAAFDIGHVFHSRVLGVGAPCEIVTDTVKVPVEVEATDYRSASARAHRDAITAVGRTPILAKEVDGDLPDGHDIVRRSDWIDQEIDATSYSSTAARASRDAIRGRGAIPLLRSESDDVDGMVTSVHGHTDASRLFARGVPERSLFWHDPDRNVWLKARPDWMIPVGDNTVIVVDLKSTVNADPREFGGSAAKFGYAFQEAWYRHVCALLGIKVAEFLFVATEKRAPFLTSVMRIDRNDVAAELPRVIAAIDLYAACSASGDWPAYPTGINDIQLPNWYRRTLENA